MTMLRNALAAWLLLISGTGWAVSITFINPGRSDETFWITAGQAMQAAARSLDVRLEMRFAERDPARAQRIAREIADRPVAERPDYVILVNDMGALVPAARVLGAAGIKSFAAFSGLLPQERGRWAPRQGLPLLLGSLQPRNDEAGYLIAKALIEQGRQRAHQGPRGRLQMLAIASDRSTPASVQRGEGLRRALAEHPDVELAEQVFAGWRRDLAARQMERLMQRHPSARLLWAGNDEMAFGAMQALQQRRVGREKSQPMLVATINPSVEALQALVDGRLAALAGGHFMTGAWALVMLYDHHHGRDFADEGLELERDLFLLFDKPRARRYLAQFGEGINELDLRPYSKLLNPQLRRYRFELEDLLR